MTKETMRGDRELSCGSIHWHQVLSEPGHSLTSPESWMPQDWQSPLNQAPSGPFQAPFQVQYSFQQQAQDVHRRENASRVDPSVTPHRSRAYTVPHSQKMTFKKELDRLIQEGVMEKCGCATWVAGTFIAPKKDGRTRWVSDFRALNKALKQKYYPPPKIQEILTSFFPSLIC